jgi:hypothetical protein
MEKVFAQCREVRMTMTRTEAMVERDQQNTRAFAERFRLPVDWERDIEGKIVNDSLLLRGRRGELYFDAGKLCMLALNTPVSGMSTEAIRGLGGQCWVGEIWRDARRRGFRDVKVQDIPEENWKQAIKLCRVRARRILSEDERAVLGARLNPAGRPSNPPIEILGSCDSGGVIPTATRPNHTSLEAVAVKSQAR